MPVYEYQCRSCGLVFQKLLLNREEERRVDCPACKGRNPKKLISRVFHHVSERDRLAAYDPNAPKADSFYKDTRNIGLDAKKRARQMGVDLGGGFENKLERLRTDPGSVLRDGE